MRLYAPLLLALLAGAHAASIPEAIKPELEKKIVVDDEKPPAENVPSEPVLVDPASTVIDVENNLKNQLKAVDIPVKVIVEEVQPAVKSAEIEPAYEVVEEEIKRPVVDLRNPGPPQHQEHENQNPEHHEDIERVVSTVKEEIQESKVILRQGFQSVTDGIQNWYANNEQINVLQNSINSLQASFSVQLQKLNDTLQSFLKPEAKPLSLEEEKATAANIQNLEAGLKNLESNFKTGVKSLSEGVQTVATLKEEGASGTGTSSSTAAPSQTINPLQMLANLVTNLQNSMTSSFNSIGQSLNSIVNNPPSITNIFRPSTAAPLADTPVEVASTTAASSTWQNIQSTFNNIFTPNQQPQQNAQNDQPTQAPSGPFGIPPFPIITSIVNFIQRPGQSQTTAKPTQAPQSNPTPAAAPQSEPASEGSNSVPVKPEEIVTKPQTETKPEPSPNPIRQLIQNNPVVQSINAAVNRIQGSGSADEPRDKPEPEAVKSEDPKPEEVKDEEAKPEEVIVQETKPVKDEAEQEKGGFIPVPIHGGHGNSVDSDQQLTTNEETQKVTEIKDDVKEAVEVSDKTE